MYVLRTADPCVFSDVGRYQVLLGGGQDAMSVTTTSLRQGKFETRFWHKIFEEEVGRVKGHFGPVNTYVPCLPCHIIS